MFWNDKCSISSIADALFNIILGDSKNSILALSFEAAKLTENAYVAWLYKLFEYKNYLNKRRFPPQILTS